ncbi:unknown [Clostridium sp. CAG:914]|jgi:hypothetical protein|nr:unknown [Clostridium sp. CAG:914]
MKLFDKIKDLFSDYEEVEEEVFLEEEKKEEYKLPKVMRDVIEKEEVILPKKKEVEEVKVEEKKFSIPIDFEKEFEMTPSRRNNTNNQNVIKEIKSVQNTSYSRQEPVKNVYMEPKPIKIEKEQKPKFKASPVISPVYGILDKNYTKEEVKEKKEDKRDIKRSSKKVDFETVRKKAFGNLVDDIKDNLMCENCELYKEVKKISSLNEDDLLYDLTLDTPSKEELTIEKCYDNYEDFGVSYEKDDVKDIIESEEKEEVNIINNNEIDSVPEKISTKELYEEEEKIDEPVAIEKQEAKIEDDFFDLVDSMYKERNDE